MTTNYEKIKNMPVEEMAKMFSSNYRCSYCIRKNKDCYAWQCIDGCMQWLLSEVENDN